MKKKVKKTNRKAKAEKIGHSEFLKTYIPGFDSLLGDGIPFGSTVLVEGGPGSGKTIFGLTVAKNMCSRGKKVLFMSFEEPEYRLRIHLKNFGAKAEEYEAKKLLYR
ncbi:MAG: ATPase domain-containing protein [Nanoarchaeota archaeon]